MKQHMTADTRFRMMHMLSKSKPNDDIPSVRGASLVDVSAAVSA